MTCAIDTSWGESPSALEVLLLKHQKGIFAYFKKRAGADTDEALNLLGEWHRRITKAWNEREVSPCRNCYRAYIFRIACNLWIDTLRAKRRRPTVSLEGEVSANTPESEELAAMHEFAQRIDRYCEEQRREGNKQLTALFLYVVAFMDREEIAKELGIKEESVGPYVSNGKRLLLERFGDEAAQLGIPIKRRT